MALDPDESKVLIISGSMGAGKTTLMGEVSDLLSMRHHPHVTIDLDAIGIHELPESLSSKLHYENLASVYNSCRETQINRFIVAAAVEDTAMLTRLTAVFEGAVITICRVVASDETMSERLRLREPGFRQDEFVERSRTLHSILEASSLEDFQVTNDKRNVTEVAEDILIRAGWITVGE